MSKKDRRRVLAQIWGTPTSHEIDMVDEGDQIVVFSNYRGIVGWWMEIFKVIRRFYYIPFCCKQWNIQSILIFLTLSLEAEIGCSQTFMRVAKIL